MVKLKERVIEIPKGFTVEVDGKNVTIKGNGKEVQKSFEFGRISLNVEGNQIKLNSKRSTRRESKMAGTIAAHLQNMINGLLEDFVYKMEIANVHFPMNVKVEGEVVVIKSFLGERVDRKSSILKGVKVEIKGNQIEVSSPDIEAAGQTAANIEKASRLTGRDRRIFQDGIYITSKPGGEI